MDENIENYIRKIENDKKAKENNILIENGYFIHENLNAGKMRFNSVFKNDRYGLTNAVFRILSSMNITNEKIVESNKLYKEIKENINEVTLSNTYVFSKYNNLNESIIHDIKGYCDTLITIVYLEKKKEFVKDVEIGSIGEYLRSSNADRIFKENEDFLDVINQLDSSYKHSFSNNMDPSRIGVYDNCIINYYSKYGKDIFNPVIISVKLDDIIKGFNEFLDAVENILKEINGC